MGNLAITFRTQMGNKPEGACDTFFIIPDPSFLKEPYLSTASFGIFLSTASFGIFFYSWQKLCKLHSLGKLLSIIYWPVFLSMLLHCLIRAFTGWNKGISVGFLQSFWHDKEQIFRSFKLPTTQLALLDASDFYALHGHSWQLLSVLPCWLESLADLETSGYGRSLFRLFPQAQYDCGTK